MAVLGAPSGTYAVGPGRVAAIRGIIFQNDGKSTIGRAFIRPIEALDRWVAGMRPSRERPPLAMHAGIHVALEDGREYVVEQLVGTLYLTFHSGLRWTPIADFRTRDRGGWDVTVDARAFRGIGELEVRKAVERLNHIHGHPFLGEDCTAFIERAFDGKRLFADSPLLRAFGIGARIGDPALPLLRTDARLDERTATLLHADAVQRLPDALAGPQSPNARVWGVRLGAAAVVGGITGLLLAARYR